MVAALLSACDEAAWLRQLFAEIDYSLSSPTVTFEDSQGSIDLANNRYTTNGQSMSIRDIMQLGRR